MGLTPGQIEIHIEEIVLHDVTPADRRAVTAALQREIEGLVARHGVDAQEQIGTQIARALDEGWR